MKPRVIWLDDDIHAVKLRPTVAKFRNSFDIIECENIDEFRDKSQRFEWDAAILDVLNADESPEDVIASITIVGKDKLWFVFSGQDSITQQDNFVKKLLSKKEYIRSYVSHPIYEKSTHNDQLIEDINNAVKNQRMWQVENQYEEVLKIADTLLDDKDCKKHLLDILSATSGVTTIDSHLYYNKIRVILEWMFRAARKQGLLHDKCFDARDHINLTDASLYMAGKATLHSGVICKQAHFPVTLADNVKFILEVTGGASHTTEVDERDVPNLTAYWASIKTPYLLYSLVFMLCDVLIWFNDYVAAHPDVIANKALGRFLILKGPVCQDAKNNYYVGDCLIPWGKMKYCKPGDIIEVTDVEETDPKFNLPYPLTAKRFK